MSTSSVTCFLEGESLRVSEVRDIHALAAFRDRWTTLHDRDPEATFFSGFEWVSIFIQTKDPDWHCLFAETTSGELVGILPLERIESAGSSSSLTTNLGAGTRSVDRASLVLDPRFEARVVDCFVDVLIADTSVQKVRFREVFDRRFDALVSKLGERGFDISRLEDTQCPVAELPRTIDEYIASLSSKSHRKNIRYYTRKLTESAGYDYRSSDTHADLERLIADHIRLFEERRKPMAPAFRELTVELIRQLVPVGKARLSICYIDDAPVASMLCLIDRPRRSTLFLSTGFAAEFDHMSPGTVAVFLAIERAIADGHVRFDFLRGAEEYKYKFGGVDEFNCNVALQRRQSGFGLRLRSLVKTITAAR